MYSFVYFVRINIWEIIKLILHIKGARKCPWIKAYHEMPSQVSFYSSFSFLSLSAELTPSFHTPFYTLSHTQTHILINNSATLQALKDIRIAHWLSWVCFPLLAIEFSLLMKRRDIYFSSAPPTEEFYLNTSLRTPSVLENYVQLATNCTTFTFKVESAKQFLRAMSLCCLPSLWGGKDRGFGEACLPI